MSLIAELNWAAKVSELRDVVAEAITELKAEANSIVLADYTPLIEKLETVLKETEDL